MTQPYRHPSAVLDESACRTRPFPGRRGHGPEPVTGSACHDRWMSRDRKVSGKLLALAAAAGLALGGCGSGEKLILHNGASHPAAKSAPGVSSDLVRVIRGWSDALRAGHVAAAARYFRIPSLFFDGSGPPVLLRTLTDAENVNAALPCGAVLISARTEGRYVNALFRLTNRAGPGGAGGCGSGAGAGTTARTNFLIHGGRIVAWLRAPDEPGDNGSPRAAPSPATPAPPPGTTPGGGTPVA
jgi:hypothetical protein